MDKVAVKEGKHGKDGCWVLVLKGRKDNKGSGHEISLLDHLLGFPARSIISHSAISTHSLINRAVHEIYNS